MSERRLVIVGGPNGSGKSTFAEEYVHRFGMAYLGADAIAAELAPHDPLSVRVAAGKQFVRRRFGRARRLFWTHYRLQADNWQLFSNTGEGFDLLAAGSGETVVEAAPDALAAFVSSLENP